MKKINKLATILCTLSLLATNPAKASYEINSEFDMHVSDSLFDNVIADFWDASKGTQTINIPNFTINPMGVPVQINGIQAKVKYSFNKPIRTPGLREWSLSSDKISASITVANISGSQVIEKVIDGNVIRIVITAECSNVELVLPERTTSVAAKIRAEVLNNQIKLSMPEFNANWQTGAWQVKSLSCRGTEDLAKVVSEEALKALSSFQSFDAEVRAGLNEKFAEWSRDASRVLLSEHELPTGKDYVNAYYEPSQAIDTNSGILLKGDLRFIYPYVAKGENIVHNYKLRPVDEEKLRQAKNPLILLPFSTVRALIMGEYFSGNLEHTIKSTEIKPFTELMHSRLKQMFGWPALRKFDKNTTFLFQFSPYGPPSFANEKPGANDSISGDMNLPLSVRMFAPNKNGVYQPMVEFRTNLEGAANLSLNTDGKGVLKLATENVNVNYKYAPSFLKAYPRVSTKISSKAIGNAIKESLNEQGLAVSLPDFIVGSSLKLKAEKWNLMDGNLRVDFTTAQSKKK